MVKLGDNLRVWFAYLIQKIAANGQVPLTIVRAGKEIAVKLPVSPDRPMVIPDLRGAYPPYFVYGPLVFSVASQQYVGAVGANANVVNMLSALGSPLVARRSDKPSFEGEELVIVSSPFFPHKLAKGYGPPGGRVVKTINGVAIQNLNHLVRVLRESKDEFITIEFCGREAEALVFPRKETVDASEDILNDNGIRSQGSPDAIKVWSAQP
jgi:hypothetical protein